MKKERKRIPITSLYLNKGQVEWLPENPRQWTKKEMGQMIKSLDEDPDFLEDRPPLVIEDPNAPGSFVVFGGNFRVAGEKRRKKVEALNCMLYTVEDPEEDRMTIIRRASKDNGSYGEWDMDILANKWDSFPLDDWGIKVWDPEAVIKKAEKDAELAARLPFVEVLNEKHNYVVLYFDKEVDWLQIESILGLEAGRRPATSENGNSEAFEKAWIGVGRVVNGPEALNKIMKQGEKL